jgi:Flp pilus assembly protein TadD
LRRPAERALTNRLALKIPVSNFTAIMKLKPPSLISKGSLDRMLKAVGEAWGNQDFPQAIELLERASRLNPSNAAILLDLGRFHGLRYDSAAAERCFEQAVRVAPNKTEMLALAGLNCRDFGNFALAEKFYLRAAEQKNASPKIFVKLAELYERLRRMDEAAAMAERALQLDRACPEALLTLARLKRQAGHLDEAEKILRAFVANPNPDAWVHTQCWYEFGGILDRQGKYDDAIAAFVQAKALLHPHSQQFIAQLKVVRNRITAMQANLTAEMLQRWFDAAPSLPPPRRFALLGGHPRSGTTLLEQVLDSHPEIVSVEETEIFHDDAYSVLQNRFPYETPILSFLEPAPADVIQQARGNYFRSAGLFLGQPVGDRLLIDKNPSLTFLIPALIRIFPEIKLLIALRDPRDVVMSCFMQSIRPGQVSAAYQRIQTTVDEYIAMMSLWQTLKPMLNGHYLEVRYEDMVDDLESVARRTLDFVGAPWDARVLGFDAHARQKVVRSPTYADVTKPVYKGAVGRWRNYQKYLEPHLEKLEPFVKAFGYE